MNVELSVCHVRAVRRAVWSLTGIIKITADEGGEECEKAKLTLTLSITFHLTHDDGIDTRPCPYGADAGIGS